MKKRIFSSLLCLVIVFSIVSLPAQARWTNCSSIELAMSYSGGKVSWTGSILGNSDTTKITASYTLEKLGSNGKYAIVDTWSGYSTTRQVLNSTDKVTDTAGTYRLTMTGTVQSASYSEPISASLVRSFS